MTDEPLREAAETAEAGSGMNKTPLPDLPQDPTDEELIAKLDAAIASARAAPHDSPFTAGNLIFAVSLAIDRIRSLGEENKRLVSQLERALSAAEGLGVNADRALDLLEETQRLPALGNTR